MDQFATHELAVAADNAFLTAIGACGPSYSFRTSDGVSMKRTVRLVHLTRVAGAEGIIQKDTSPEGKESYLLTAFAELGRFSVQVNAAATSQQDDNWLGTLLSTAVSKLTPIPGQLP